MRILVTGCSGYVGTHLVPRLIREGHVIHGVDRRAATSQELERFTCGDLCDATVAEEAVSDVERIVHLAAAKDDWGISEEKYFRDNVEATQQLIDTGIRHGVHSWFFYGSVAALSPSTSRATADAPSRRPVTPYGASKARAESLFRDLVKRDPAAEVTIIRPSAIFGPDNPRAANVFRLTHALYTRRFVMVGDGAALKTTSYIENVIEATIFLMERARRGVDSYTYVDEPIISTAQLVVMLCGELGRKPPRFHVPVWLATTAASVFDIIGPLANVDFPITRARIKKFCTETVYDASRIRKVGFRQPVSNEEAVRRTVKWYHQAVAARRVGS